MKKKKIISFAIASMLMTTIGVSSVKAYYAGISFSPSSATFTVDNHPYAANLMSVSTYTYTDIFHKHISKHSTHKGYGVLLTDAIKAPAHCKSYYAEMTPFVNGSSSRKVTAYY